MQKIGTRIADVADYQIVSMRHRGRHRGTHSTKTRLRCSITKQSRIDATKPIFHAPHDNVSLFRSPAKLPVRRMQSKTHQRVNSLTTSNLPRSFTTNSIRNHEPMCGFFEQLTGHSFIDS